jgi:hypothetical protein
MQPNSARQWLIRLDRNRPGKSIPPQDIIFAWEMDKIIPRAAVDPGTEQVTLELASPCSC